MLRSWHQTHALRSMSQYVSMIWWRHVFFHFMQVMHALSDVQALRKLVLTSESASEAFQYVTKTLDPLMLYRIWRCKYYDSSASPEVFRTSLTYLFPLWPLYPAPACLLPWATPPSTSRSSLPMLRPRPLTGAPQCFLCLQFNGTRWPAGPRHCMQCSWRQEW